MTNENASVKGTEEIAMSSAKTRFILTGFSQAVGIRTFTFESIAADRTRTIFTVKADLALTRTYDIRLQELPLLCREVLDRRREGEENCTFTYTEEDMRRHADDCAAARAAAAQKRGSRRPSPPTSELAGSFHSGNQVGPA